MRHVWTIAMREFKVYFTSPIAYIVLTIFAIIFGYFFTTGLAFFLDYSASMAAQGGGMGAPTMNVNQFVVEPALGNMSIVLLFLAPMITMRLFAEENRSGTIELLLTSPLRDYHIIPGQVAGGAPALRLPAAGRSPEPFCPLLVLVAGLEAGRRVAARPPADGRHDARARHLSLDAHQEPDCRRRPDLRPSASSLGA